MKFQSDIHRKLDRHPDMREARKRDLLNSAGKPKSSITFFLKSPLHGDRKVIEMKTRDRIRGKRFGRTYVEPAPSWEGYIIWLKQRIKKKEVYVWKEGDR